jgi:hypothetical protein
MTTRTHAPPATDLDQYRDACEHCIRTETDRDAYTALPARIRHTPSGIVARYRHTCGHTWTVGWFHNRT